MEFYQGNFAAFVLLNILLAYREYRQEPATDAGKTSHDEATKIVVNKFKWNFIPIYLLVNGADWLQVGRSISVG
jgi:hypothetical protein